MKSVESIKARLKNEALKSGRLYNEVLTMYMLERLLYRISISTFSENFILKGGVLLYMLYDKKYPRATADIDLLAKQITNDTDQIRDLFKEIINVSYDNDFITYSIDSLAVSEIVKGNNYNGVNVSVISFLGSSKQKLSIDICFGDKVIPNSYKMELPVILETEIPILNVYSKESIISEKLDAIVSLGELNSRFKDFYDIYKLLSTTKFDKRLLQEAIKETFMKRGTSFQIAILKNEEYITNPSIERMWNNMKRKRGINEELSFVECVSFIRDNLEPIIDELGVE